MANPLLRAFVRELWGVNTRRRTPAPTPPPSPADDYSDDPNPELTAAGEISAETRTHLPRQRKAQTKTFYAVRAYTSSGWMPVSLLSDTLAGARLMSGGWVASLSSRLLAAETILNVQIIETDGLTPPRIVEVLDMEPTADANEDVGF